ncbi:MAG TPA: hypothetical protein IAC38_02295 [Candidatus Caccovivens faecavium]|nr:hypothetical protein [Candidatus Caccovivens faecavium]
MKKLKVFNLKFCLIILALLMPIAVTGIVASFFKDYALGETGYLKEYVEEVSVTNNNFNSSTINSISESPSGWSKILNNSGSTAGIINVGSNFENYKNSTYRLSVNPGKKSSDNQILMINSKTNINNKNVAREGFESNTISLDANSFYSFKVSYKSDTNYEEDKNYVYRGEIENSVNVTSDRYRAVEFGDDSYVQITYLGSTFYVNKNLTSAGTLQNAYTTNKSFYVDSSYIGYNYKESEESENITIYSKIEDVESITILDGTTLYDDDNGDGNTITQEGDVTLSIEDVEFNDGDYLFVNIGGRESYVRKSDVNFTFNAGTEYFNSTISFTPNTSNQNSGTFSVNQGTSYYSQNTIYNSLDEYGVGSIYLKGLVDENGEEIELKYEKVTSTEWTTFYFFIVTGDSAQEVSLELWLGGEDASSTGVVYFDEVLVNKYSENLFYKTYQDYKDKFYNQTNKVDGTTTQVLTSQFLTLAKDNSISINANLDFEDDFGSNGLGGWTKQGEGNARILSLDALEGFESTTGYDFVGSNLGVDVVIDDDGNIEIKNNRQAMALWANNNYVEVKSKDIEIKTHKIYKVTASYKISEITGTAYLKIQENENIYKEIPLLNESNYTLASGSTNATTNVDNNFTNDYGTLTIYIKGSELYNSSVNIVLALGSSDSVATGCVVFDDVKVEEVGYSELATAQEDSASVVTINENTAEQSIANGNFNATQDEDGNYPLTPSDWTIESGDGLNFGGVINTKESEYNSYVDLYRENIDLGNENKYLWAVVGNPLAPNNSNEYYNNILMLNNHSANYQSLTSPTFTLEANSYYNLTFNYKTLSTNVNKLASFNIGIYNEDGVLLFEEENVTSDRWQTYEIYFETFTGSENVYVKIDFGTSENLMSGYAYFDNFELNSMEASAYDEIRDTNKNIVDMTDFYMHLPTNNVTDELRDFSSGAYTTSGYDDEKEGGIVNASYFDDNSTFRIDTEEEDKRVFVLQTKSNTTYTIDSIFKFDLTSGNYYTLTFKLKTNFAYLSSKEDIDLDEHDYGGIVGLSGFDYMTNLVSNDEYAEYTLHIHATEDTSSTLHLGLQSDDFYTTGTMVLYDLSFTEIASDEDNASEAYDNAVSAMEDKNYDINTDRTFATSTEATDDSSDTDTDNGEDAETTENNDNFTWLLLIASLITGLAIVIAIVGYFMRKVKIKKIETKRKETYDRKGTIHRDVIRKEAEEERNKEISELEANIQKFENELNSLEKEHKEKVVKLRKEDKSEISKTTEKEFKLFAQKRSIISEKIDILKHQLENIKSPEHLLTLERKKYLEAENKQKALKKEAKDKDKKTKKDVDEKNKKD